MTALFASGSPKLFTLPSGENFLKGLALSLSAYADLKNTPDGLADALIYVPNRRSARRLAFELYQAADRAPLILPDIRPLGDLETDDGPSGTEDALAGLAPSLPPAERLGEMSKLVSAFFSKRGTPLPPASSISAARDLLRLLDQAALSETVNWEKLNQLNLNSELAQHWEESVRFLEIITNAWPEYLKSKGVLDPFERRRKVAEAVAEEWQRSPPLAPVILAGSTGATPASRVLMKAALNLPSSALILPGLDQNVSKRIWEQIKQSPNHPQYALANLLVELDKNPKDVSLWPGTTENQNANARRKLINEALAPAEDTAGWLERLEVLSEGMGQAAFVQKAISGLSLISAKDEAEEAQIAALLMRQILEDDTQSCSLVTPDPALSRRVSALLKRWGVNVSPSRGTPLSRSPTGSLILLVFDWLMDPADPIALSKVAKHQTVTCRGGVSALERAVLRGPRRWTTLSDLNARLDQTRCRVETDKERAKDTLSTLQRASTHNFFDGLPLNLSEYADIVLDSVQILTEGAIWQGSEGEAISDWIETFRTLGQSLDPMSPHSARDVLNSLGLEQTTHPAHDHPRLSIHGPLEARLQSADRIILAGLNEGIWPNRLAPDAFLPRRFRPELGLNDPEDRIGLAAHDFAQLACSPHVYMLVAERRDDAPAIASRWVWRLQTLIQGALGTDLAKELLQPDETNDPRHWIKALDPTKPLPSSIARPKPTPPIEARPKRLSVTRIDTLQRDPYAIYAEQILKLNVLDPLGGPLGPAERGTATHAALEAFEADNTPKSEAHLMALLEASLKDAGMQADAIAANRAPLQQTVAWYLDWRAARLPDIADLKLESSGKLDLQIGEQTFTLSAQADRIELKRDGTLAILDFKTGTPATDKQIATGLDQQMPLQALIALAGGFETLSERTVSSLEYVAFRAKPDHRFIGQSKYLDANPAELADTARTGLEQLIKQYGRASQAYLSAPRVQFVKYDYGYNRLARRDEWLTETSDE